MKKRLFVALGLTAITLAGCGGNAKVDMTKWEFTPANATEIKIGILQPVEHPALDQAREGFEAAVNAGTITSGAKVTFNYQNANGVEADITSLSKSLTTSCDMTLGIGTGASVALKSAQINSGSTKPILFTAVTDAVTAELVDSNENPGGYVTGTSDANPVEAQIDLIKECLPTATKIGILYTQSEINSEVQANQAKAEAEKQGLQVEIATCTSESDLKNVATDLCGSKGIQALYIPTDNLIAANTPTVKSVVDKYHILTVCGEESMTAGCGHVTLSVNYYQLGYTTGQLAIQIINKDKKPNEIAVTTMAKEACSYVFDSSNCTDASITIPDSVKAKFTDLDAQ